MKIVIMAGGGGTRLWPVSRNANPKQFQPLTSGASLLQETARRVMPLAGRGGVYVTTSASMLEQVRADLPQVDPAHVFLEPARRDNAAAIGLAILRLLHETGGEDDTFVMLPSDHAILHEQVLQDLVRAAEQAVAATPDAIVTIGIRPTSPETGYGYIKLDDATRQVVGGHEQFRVERFVEKPDRVRAEQFLQDWTYLWNAGIYVFRLRTMWQLYQTFLPELSAGLERIAAAFGTPDADEVLAEVYPTLPATSIDFGITEKAPHVLVFPSADLGWSDIGSWQSVRELLPKDLDGNVIRGQHVGLRTRDCLVFGSPDRVVATLGVRDLVIIDTPDALLVADAKDAASLKQLVEELKARGLEKLL